jgi:integrase
MELRLVLGRGEPDVDTLVFSTIEGGFIRPRNLTKTWYRARTAMKLPAVSFHDFRHSHVSMLIKAGVDILTITPSAPWVRIPPAPLNISLISAIF